MRQLLKILGLDFLLDKEGKMASGPQMQKDVSEASRDKSQRVGWGWQAVGRRWAEGGQELKSGTWYQREALSISSTQHGHHLCCDGLGLLPGEPPAVKESGPWAGEEAGEPRPWGKEAGG